MRIRYQASLFADLSKLGATPDNTVAVLTNLLKNGLQLLPSTMQEISPPMMTPVARMRFATSNGDTEVNIASGRLDLIKQAPGLLNGSVGSIQDFVSFAEKATFAVLQDRDILGTRLALVVQFVRPENTGEAMNTVFSKLFSAPAFYAQHESTEWTFRANAPASLEFAGFKERTNTILKVERVQGISAEGNGNWREFDRILCELDINTLLPNAQQRFPLSALRPFIDAAAAAGELVETDLTAKLVN